MQMTESEIERIRALDAKTLIAQALQLLRFAETACDREGLGSAVVGPLSDACRDAGYALRVLRNEV